jgi:iron(III) transport system substrate-binding protein
MPMAPMWPSSPNWSVKEGTLKAPVGPAAAAWPAAYMRGNTYPVLALEPLIVVYNTNVIKTPITGYQDFLRPEFKGTKFGTNTMAATTVIAWYEWLDKSFGADFTTKLAAQQPRMYAGTVQSTQSTAAGEVGATLYSTPGIAIPVADRGAPVKILYPNPSFGIRLGGGIMGWSKRPNAAQVFVNYAMTPRGQTAWVGPLGGTASPLPNIPNSLDPKTINPYDPAQYPPEVVKTLTEKYNRIFQGN